jgi:hypothetical protein
VEINAPYFSYDTLRERAEAFLGRYHPSREIPVPIEEIVEFQFEMDIVPEPGLHQHFDVDSYITADLKEIRVDEFVYQSRPGRYRFSLAHELGHRVLHEEAFAKLTFDSVAAWKALIANAIPEKEYGYLEWQASSFAGLMLVPGAELASKYGEVCRIVQQHGLSLQADSEVARSLISEHIAGFFVVSPAVVRRRLEYDGIWGKTG